MNCKYCGGKLTHTVVDDQYCSTSCSNDDQKEAREKAERERQERIANNRK